MKKINWFARKRIDSANTLYRYFTLIIQFSYNFCKYTCRIKRKKNTEQSIGWDINPQKESISVSINLRLEESRERPF